MKSSSHLNAHQIKQQHSLTENGKLDFLAHHLEGLIGDGLAAKDALGVKVDLHNSHLLAASFALLHVQPNARQCLMMDGLAWTRN